MYETFSSNIIFLRLELFLVWCLLLRLFGYLVIQGAKY